MSGVIHKRLETADTKPQAGEIEKAEIAINLVDRSLWTKDQNGNIISVGGNIDDPIFPADEGLVWTAKQAGNEWSEVIGTPDETGKIHQTITNTGVKKGSYWTPAVSTPGTITESFALVAGQNGTLVSPTIPDGVDITIPDGSTLVIL